MELRIRPACASDHPLVSRLYPELGSGDEVPPLERWIANEMANTTVCERGGASLGFLHAQVLEGEGYVRQVVADPSARGLGVGRALLGAFAARLRSSGCDRWRLNVEPDNGPAIALYESLGLGRSHEGVAIDFPWEWLDVSPADATGEAIREPRPADFADLERRMALPSGQLAERASVDSIHLRVIGAGEPLGLAAFDVAFPGCFPFRADTFPRAVDLLRGLRPLAQTPDMRIVLEDAPALDAAFVAAGARPHLRFLHMTGTVPPASDPA